jgi:hypothetical protein
MIKRHNPSGAAERPRAKPLGGSGSLKFSRWNPGRQATPPNSPASRVSISEVLGGEKLDCHMEMA